MIKVLKENQTINNIDDVDKFLLDNLKGINDQAFADVLRDIITQQNLDLKKVANSIEKHMPEVYINI